MLVRPCFLVLDHEFAGSISSRKLVLETAKFNVITAYSCEEAMATLDAFPGIHGIVLNALTADKCPQLLPAVRDRLPHVKRVVIEHGGGPYPVADRTIESFRPDQLLETLRALFPQQTAELDRKEKILDQQAAAQNNAGSQG